MGKKLTASTCQLSVVHKEIIDGHIFTIGRDHFRKPLYPLRKAMCKQGSVLSVGMFCLNIKRYNVIEMTICVHAINGVIRRKKSTRL